MAWYVPLEPRPDLAGSLACVWTALPSGRHRLVPDGCMDLLWIRRDGRAADATTDATTGATTGATVDEWWLCGPERKAWTFALPAGSVAVGARFRPGHASALLGIDASALLDRRVRGHTVLPAEVTASLDARYAAIDGRSIGADTDGYGTGLVERVRALEAALAPLIRSVPAGDVALVDAVVDAIVRSPRARQDELARAVGLTARQLHRRTVRAFGYGTATLSRLVRFQRFLAVREGCGGPLPSTAVLAGLAGYADQSHLSRDCVAITGLTVRRFLDEWFPTFPDMSDPFKTSSPLAPILGA